MNKDYIYKRRYLKLADFLDTVKRKDFNFKFWISPNWDGKQVISCGTTGCALGHAATMPIFRRLGMSIFWEGSFPVVGFKSDVGDRPMLAAQKIFGCTPAEFQLLFVPNEQLGINEVEFLKEIFGMSYSPPLTGKATPKQAAARIRRFVKWKFK